MYAGTRLLKYVLRSFLATRAAAESSFRSQLVLLAACSLNAARHRAQRQDSAARQWRGPPSSGAGGTAAHFLQPPIFTDLWQKVVTAAHCFSPPHHSPLRFRLFLSKGVQKHQGAFMQKKIIGKGDVKHTKTELQKKNSEKAPARSPFLFFVCVCVCVWVRGCGWVG